VPLRGSRTPGLDSVDDREVIIYESSNHHRTMIVEGVAQTALFRGRGFYVNEPRTLLTRSPIRGIATEWPTVVEASVLPVDFSIGPANVVGIKFGIGTRAAGLFFLQGDGGDGVHQGAFNPLPAE